MDSLVPDPAAERAALLPSAVRLMLASFLEDVTGEDGAKEGKAPPELLAKPSGLVCATWGRSRAMRVGDMRPPLRAPA